MSGQALGIIMLHTHPEISRMKHIASPDSCPLCSGPELTLIGNDRYRPYFSCGHCQLISVPPGYHLSPEQEKDRYDQHKNNSKDPSYREFLNQLAQPLQERLRPNSSGLDFGAGPGPTLSLMLQEAGHTMSIYDPFYAYNPALLKRTYDFITATEVAEHLHHPGLELDHLWSRLKGYGILGIMTQLAPPDQPFLDWYYIKDPTHVCFFSEKTWPWLSLRWNAEIIYLEKNVVLFRKPSDSQLR